MATEDLSSKTSNTEKVSVPTLDPHASGSFDPQPGVARLSHAERSRTLIATTGRGLLSTVAREPAGYPFGSLVTFVVDDQGCPWLLVSTMAEHTRNAMADPRASMLVAEEAAPGVDPLALSRVSLIGDLTHTEPDAALRAKFLETHPGAAYYVDFPDFGFYRLAVSAVRYVGGFGRMSWVEASEYSAARADPIAPFAAGIVEHMNTDHAESHLLLLRHWLGRSDIESATMTEVDRLGCDFDTVTPSGRFPLRLEFTDAVSTSEEVRQMFISMLGPARQSLGR